MTLLGCLESIPEPRALMLMFSLSGVSEQVKHKNHHNLSRQTKLNHSDTRIINTA